MKKLRKIAAIAMTAALACSVLAGCGGTVEGGNTASVRSWLYIPQSDMDKFVASNPEEIEIWDDFLGKWEVLSEKYTEKDMSVWEANSQNEEDYQKELAALDVQYQKDLAKLEKERDAELAKLEQALDKSMTDSEYEQEKERIWKEYAEKEAKCMLAKSDEREELNTLLFSNKINSVEFVGRLQEMNFKYFKQVEKLEQERNEKLVKLEAERNS